MTQKSEQQSTGDQVDLSVHAHILATKLYVPPGRPNAISRPRLVDKLLSGAERPGCFALLSGPAGFGKTTLLSEFVARRQHPTAWLSLDDNDNEPNRFWTYVVTACQTIANDVGDAVLELLNTAQQLPDNAVPTLLINELSQQTRSIALILDDYHEIQNPSIHRGLQILLDYLPPNVYIILSTRIDPPLPLVRYRARHQLIEIRAQDLRFDSNETAKFLRDTMQLDLSEGAIAALEERTEGWIAGLQLAALSIQGHSDVSAFIRAFSGSHVYIAEYLLEEILQKQSDDIQLFLLQTAILDRMNAALCEAVTGYRDSHTILTDLHRSNIFIVPLDDQGHWFRYHHLFADLLRARLQQQVSADHITTLHLRASGWYEAHGQTLEAVNYALTARDFERAATLVDQAGQQMVFTDHNRLKAWLDELPAQSFQSHPRLEIYRVLIDLSLGKLDMSEETLQQKEDMIKTLPPSPENDRLRLEALVYLTLFLAHQNTTRTIQIARETLEEIPESNLRLRAFLFSALYRAYGMEGDIEKSAPAYRECLRLAQSANDYRMVAVTTMVRAFDLCQYGRLDEAIEYCQVIVDASDRSRQRVFYPAGPAYIGLAGVHLERNELELAEEYLAQGIELCQRSGMDGLYTGYIQRSRLLQAQGRLDDALEELHRLEQALQRRDFTLTTRQVSLRLAMGDTAGVARLTAPLLNILSDPAYARHLPVIAVEAFKLNLARIYLAQNNVEQSNQILDEIQATVETGGRLGRLLEIYLLRARIAQESKYDEAVRYIQHALEIAEPARFVTLLLEEGSTLIPLLKASIRHQSTSHQLKTYAGTLLDAFHTVGQPRTTLHRGEATDLVESLTPREMEVLQLIALGDSNQTIADKLVVTVRTVKKHVTNILGKLDVSNRTQAVARARDVGLITGD